MQTEIKLYEITHSYKIKGQPILKRVFRFTTKDAKLESFHSMVSHKPVKVTSRLVNIHTYNSEVAFVFDWVEDCDLGLLINGQVYQTELYTINDSLPTKPPETLSLIHQPGDFQISIPLVGSEPY